MTLPILSKQEIIEIRPNSFSVDWVTVSVIKHTHSSIPQEVKLLKTGKNSWLSLRVLCLAFPAGGGKEVQRFWHPQRDDGHLEVPEQRLHSWRVHQHLPQWQGDWDCLRRRSKEAGQISSSVLAFSHHSSPHDLPFYTPPHLLSSALGLMLSFMRKKKKLWTSFPSLLLYRESPMHEPFLIIFYEDL